VNITGRLYPENFPRVQRRHCAYPFQVTIAAVQQMFTILCTLSTPQTVRIAATVTKMRFVGEHSQVYYDNCHHRQYAHFQNSLLFTAVLHDFILPSKTSQHHLTTRAAKSEVLSKAINHSQ